VGYHTQKFSERRFKARGMRKNNGAKRQNRIASKDSDYGNTLNEINNAPDMSPEDFESAKLNFLHDLNKLDVSEIEKNTFGQNTNPQWHNERSLRLTASNFGKNCKMKPHTDTANTVKCLLKASYSSNKLPKSLAYGIENEANALHVFQNQTNLKVEKCGLFVDSEIRFLAASPDSLIGAASIVEVKCPYSARDVTVKEGIETKKIDYCTLDKDENVILKSNHNYMFQIQGQLHITKRDTCYFIVYTKVDLKFCIIKKDDAFWENHMRFHLEKFYLNAVLPEIIDSRLKRNLPIRNLLKKNL
jgi:hypothetical protein